MLQKLDNQKSTEINGKGLCGHKPLYIIGYTTCEVYFAFFVVNYLKFYMPFVNCLQLTVFEIWKKMPNIEHI